MPRSSLYFLTNSLLFSSSSLLPKRQSLSYCIIFFFFIFFHALARHGARWYSAARETLLRAKYLRYQQMPGMPFCLIFSIDVDGRAGGYFLRRRLGAFHYISCLSLYYILYAPCFPSVTPICFIRARLSAMSIFYLRKELSFYILFDI